MKIDYLNGRSVLGVIQGSQDWDWQIRLEDGSTIRNTDQRRTSPPGSEIVGSALLESHPDMTGAPGNIELVFGSVIRNEDGTSTVQLAATVKITESQYLLARPGQAAVNPSDPEPTAEDFRPIDPSSERVVDGPETPQEAQEDDE